MTATVSAKKGYIGWALPEEDRERLLTIITPVYPDVIAHHVTLQHGVTEDAVLSKDTIGFVIGIADDGAGVQALIVDIGGTIERPDGKTYHITWSIDRAAGRKPVDSNQVIANFGYDLVSPIRISLVPSFFG